LIIFESVGRLGSISRAAGELNLTQPAVSMQVKQLEEQIGLPLIDHAGKKLVLTEAGEELARHAREMIGKMADLKSAMKQYLTLECGILRIALISTMSFFLPRIVSEYVRRHPSVRISLQVDNHESVLAALVDKRTDIAILGRPPEDASLVAHQFMDNPLVVIARPDHPLAQLDRVPLDLLGEEAMIAREQGSGTQATTERFFAQKGLEFRSSCEVNTNEAVKQAVAAGLGLAIAPLRTIELELETRRLAVLPVDDFPILRHWFLMHRADRRLPLASRAFCELFLGQASSGGLERRS
jgi:LysR family transcriptional regulator, low CO2-responsive transcriptional regulator